MPKRERQHPHQRPITVVTLATGSGLRRFVTRSEARQRGPGLNADVEHVAIDGEIAMLEPVHHASTKIAEVELLTLEQRREQTQRLRAIVRPRARSDTLVSTNEPRRRSELEQL